MTEDRGQKTDDTRLRLTATARQRGALCLRQEKSEVRGQMAEDTRLRLSATARQGGQE
jgi:hypothetical protein